MEQYNAQDFITEADSYYGQTPKDLTQCAEKLWFSFVYCVKEYFLSMGVHIKSHRGIRTLAKLAINESK